MANTKTIITRIKNKVDTLAKWNAYTGTLLDGEIAVVRVPTGESYTNPVTGKNEPVVELLMKVGDGSTDFADLKWMSAKASDVYDWAKAATVEFDTTDYKVKFKDASDKEITKATIDMSHINGRLTALEGKKIAVTPTGATENGVVQAVVKGTGDHDITVTYGLVQTADVADSAITEAKIATDAVTTAKIKDANVTTAKIADKAVTDAKIDTVSASKVIYTAGTTDETTVTLPEKIEEVEGKIATINSEIAGGVHFIGTVTAKPDTSSVLVTKDGTTKTVTAEAGDIVVWSAESLEYIYTGSDWEELGDPSGLGAIVEALDYTGGAFGTSKFVTKVTQENGQIAAEYAQPTSADVTHDGSTVKAALEALDANKVDKATYDQHSHTISAGAEDDDVVVLEGTAGTNGVSYKATHAASGVTAGTYRSVTVDAKGHVTAGTNPTTRDDYGLTDVYTKDEADAAFMTDAEVDAVVTPIKNNYVRFTETGKNDKDGNATYQMHLGTGADVVIFDCGGAND